MSSDERYLEHFVYVLQIWDLHVRYSSDSHQLVVCFVIGRNSENIFIVSNHRILFIYFPLRPYEFQEFQDKQKWWRRGQVSHLVYYQQTLNYVCNEVLWGSKEHRIKCVEPNAINLSITAHAPPREVYIFTSSIRRSNKVWPRSLFPSMFCCR